MLIILVGGESCRVNNYEFTAKRLGALGVQDIEDMKEAANYRGGECLSNAMERGDIVKKTTNIFLWSFYLFILLRADHRLC